MCLTIPPQSASNSPAEDRSTNVQTARVCRLRMVVVTQAPNIIERLVGVLDSCGIALNLFTTRLERGVGTQTHLLQVRPVCEAWSKVMDTVTSDTGGISYKSWNK